MLGAVVVAGCNGLDSGRRPTQAPRLHWDRGPTIFVAVDPDHAKGVGLQWSEYGGSLRQAMAEFSILPSSWNRYSRFGVFTPSASVDGHYEVYVLDLKGQRQRIATFPATRRSYVDGHAARGVLRVYQIVRVGDDKRVLAISAPQAGVRGPSLATELGFDSEFAGPIPEDTSVVGWGKPTGGEAVADVDGRPGSPGRIFLHLCPVSRRAKAAPVRVRLLSKRIPIQPGRSYLQTGWVRARRRAAAVYVGRVWLDQDRRELHTSYMAVGARSPHWTFFSQQLMPDAARVDPSDYRYQFGDWAYAIPRGARYCRLSILADVTRDGADFDDFTFCEIRQFTAPVVDKKAAPPTPTPKRAGPPPESRSGS